MLYLWWLYLESHRWASDYTEDESWLLVISKEAVDPDSPRGERITKLESKSHFTAGHTAPSADGVLFHRMVCTELKIFFFLEPNSLGVINRWSRGTLESVWISVHIEDRKHHFGVIG